MYPASDWNKSGILDIFEPLRCYVRAKTFNFLFSQILFKLGRFSETIYSWLASIISIVEELNKLVFFFIEVKTARF